MLQYRSAKIRGVAVGIADGAKVSTCSCVVVPSVGSINSYDDKAVDESRDLAPISCSRIDTAYTLQVPAVTKVLGT